MKKIVLIFLVVVVLLIAVLLIWNWKKQPKTQNQPVQESQEQKKDLSNINPQDYTDMLNSNFTKAKAKAVEWKSDAQFVFLKVQILENLNPALTTETYVFDSANSPSMYWTIGFSLQGDSIRALVWKSDFLKEENPKKIATQYWEMDWISAFQKAEKNGGKESREKYASNLEITANLTYVQPKGYLCWSITYSSLISDDKETISIDAKTGEVLD